LVVEVHIILFYTWFPSIASALYLFPSQKLVTINLKEFVHYTKIVNFLSKLNSTFAYNCQQFDRTEIYTLLNLSCLEVVDTIHSINFTWVAVL